MPDMDTKKLRSLLVAATLAAAALPSLAQTAAWSRSVPGTGNTASMLGDGSIVTRTLAVDGAGNAFVTGTTGSGASADFVTAKVSGSTGAIAWQKSFAGAGGNEDDAYAIATDAAGNAIVAGMAFTTSGNIDIQVIKYAAADGSVLWSRTIDNGTYDAAYGVAVDPSGDVLVAAESSNASNVDIHVIKLAGSNGATAWDRKFDGGADDFVTDFALDAAGNAILLGISVNSAGNDDIKLLKYGIDGTLAWQQTWSTSGDDEGYALALDKAGNAFVTGYVNGASGKGDAKTIKFAAATGAIAWQQTYDGGNDDSGQSVAVDAAGNAIVAIQSQNASGNYDFRTIKYAAADGSVLWSKSFDGGGDDFVYQAAVDAAGNAVVAGSAHGANGDDWKVLIYGSTDGTVLGQYGYNGSANLGEAAFNLVVTNAGIYLGGISTETGSPQAIRVAKLSNVVTVSSTAIDLEAARLDFDGNGKSDLLFQHRDGSLRVNLMNGISSAPGVTIVGPTSNAVSLKAGDFNGDGRTDLVRSFSDGSATMYLMSGSAIASQAALRAAGSGWSLLHVGDFNGDGKTDILWQQADGSVEMDIMDGTRVTSATVIMNAGTTWTALKVGDFNGDGKADILWRNVDGSVSVWLMNGPAILQRGTVMPATPVWTPVQVGDLDGDGKADILWQSSADGTVSAWLMNGLAIAQRAPIMPAGSGWNPVRLLDANGDHRADIAWSYVQGNVGLWLMGGLAQSAKAPQMGAGTGWSLAGSGDFNGDGKDDLVWSSTDGTVSVWLMNGLAQSSRAAVEPAGTGWSVLH